jgi:hypothetical protein
MDTLVTQPTEDQIANSAIDSSAATSTAAPKKFGVITIPKLKKTAPVPAAAATAADDTGDLVHKIENLKRPDALAKLAELDAAHERSCFEIGGVLSVIQKNGWFDPYSSFNEWVEKEAGMKRGKARALTRVYDVIVGAGISPAHFKKIDWTKLRALTPVLTPDNTEYWCNAAAKNSRAELEELVKQHKAASAGAAKPGGSTASHKWTFKFHDDQNETVTTAIDKAKKASGTEHDSVAIELICLGYLGAHGLADWMKKIGVESALKALEEAFPGLDFNVSMPESHSAVGVNG